MKCPHEQSLMTIISHQLPATVSTANHSRTLCAASKANNYSAVLNKISGGIVHSQPIRGLGNAVSSPSGVRGRAPAGNTFWRILMTKERSFYTYMLML